MSTEDVWGDAAMAEAMERALRYEIPCRVYSVAFSSFDGDRSAEECATIITLLVDAAIYGSENSLNIMTIRDDEIAEAAHEDEMWGDEE
jgi:hypothetical protein